MRLGTTHAPTYGSLDEYQGFKSKYWIEKVFPYDVHIYMGTDGVPVIDIDTLHAEERGEHHTAGIPSVRLWVNDDIAYEYPPP